MQKGFISRLMILIVLALIVFIIVSFANLMTAYGVKSGQYSNPNVASTVVRGSIYDRKGTALAVYTPDIVYPLSTHAYSLIEEVRQAYEDKLNPKPGYDQAITYGNNVYLTIDSEIQNQMDQAIKSLASRQKAKEAVAFLANSTTGEIIASSVYPFVQPYTEGTVNNGFIRSIDYMGTTLTFSFISKITDYQGNVVALSQDIDYDNGYFTQSSYQATEIKTIGNKYVLWIWTDKNSVVGISNFSSSMENALKAQSMI